MDEKIDRITKEEYDLVSPLEKHKKRIKISIMFGIFIDYINKIGVKSNVNKTVFYDYIEKYNLELVTIDEYSYYLCKQKYNVVRNKVECEVEQEVDLETEVEPEVEDYLDTEVEDDLDHRVEDELESVDLESEEVEDLEDEVSSIETKLNKQVPKADDIIYHNSFGKIVYIY
jgi:hypothetical protein